VEAAASAPFETFPIRQVYNLAGGMEDKILAPACMSTALIRPFIGCYCCRSLFNYQLNGFWVKSLQQCQDAVAAK